MYTASADWMGRNLDRRVEVAMPINDPEVYAELRKIISLQLADNTKARTIDQDQSNTYVRGHNKERIRAQVAIYKLLQEKLNVVTV